MSTDLIEYINALPIKTYLLSSDTLVIGRVLENRVESIELQSLCSIETFYEEDSMRQIILPLVPGGFDQRSTISRSHIVIESPASILLKKSYCDALLHAKIQTQIGIDNGSAQSTSSNLETFKNQKNSNKWGDRWNN